MTDEQINAIREFDEQKFRAERVYLEKKVPLAEADEFCQTTEGNIQYERKRQHP